MILLEVVNILESLPLQPDTAAQIHAAAMLAFRREGFEVFPEFDMPYAGREGRIDIVVLKGGEWAGIELDARKPRKNSIRKLLQFKGLRIIGLRGVSGEAPDGIDAIAKIPVRLAAETERKDKRTVAKFRSQK